MEQHNAHCYAFFNAPLRQRKEWCRFKLAELHAELDGPVGNRGADGYYAIKDEIREYRAALADTTPARLDPVGFWFGMQSN